MIGVHRTLYIVRIRSAASGRMCHTRCSGNGDGFVWALRSLSSLLPLVAIHIYLLVGWLAWGSRLAVDQPIWPED